MKRKLSSNLTPIYKFVFPAPWFLCGIYVLSGYARSWADSTTQHLMGVFLFWLFGGTLFYLSFGRLKAVYIEDEWLYVSNFLKSVRIPLKSVKSVDGSSIWTSKIRKVFLTFDYKTPFGKRIEFAPAASTTEIVNDLKNRLNLSLDFHRPATSDQ